MTSTLLMLALSLCPADDTEKKAHKPSAIAPSLRALTREEEAKMDEIVERLILSDTGRLRGAAAKKAQEEFNALKAEAIPAMIRGLNKSARLNYSCPILLIGRKLNSLLMASNDPELLQYAHDEIGADLRRSRYSSTLQDLRLKCTLRRNALARNAPPRPKGPAALTTAQLAKAANTERGPQLKGVLTELAKRTGKEVIPALAFAADSYDKDTAALGRTLLDGHLSKQTAAQVADKLTDDSAQVRRGAIRVIAAKHAALVGKIIDRLTDDEAEVRAEAHAALVKVSKGEDFGPSTTADKTEQREAQKKWRAWWSRRSG